MNTPTQKQNRKRSAASSDWTDLIRDEPLLAVAVAAATGFFAGGGAATTPGRAATSVVTRIVAREVAAYLAGSVLATTLSRGSMSSEKEQ
jgi:hypothetical protein